jgi:hypothetical protein
MKLIIKNIGILLMLAFISVSCDNNPTLQKYFVDSKENDQFIAVDLPASILQLKNDEVSDEIKKTLETIKKINFLALQITDTNKELYNSEKEKVKLILKNPKYKQLMRMNLENANVSINYLGEENAIDEVVIFGSENEKGFAIIRVIGENMDPSAIMKLTQEIKVDDNSTEMKQLEGLLSAIN